VKIGMRIEQLGILFLVVYTKIRPIRNKGAV